MDWQDSQTTRYDFDFIDRELQRHLEQTTSLGRSGSKLDLLIKHLLFIHDKTSEDKTIVFSAFSRGLELVADALRQNGLRFVAITSGSRNVGSVVQSFVSGDVRILLLHSEQTSAGLNLTATKNIILLEPLVNSGAERQALGRVHRIGQTKETHVFCYVVRNSVEERILRLAAHRGQSLYIKADNTSADSENGVAVPHVDSGPIIAATVANKAARGDYVSSVDDLLSCFFDQHTQARTRTR